MILERRLNFVSQRGLLPICRLNAALSEVLALSRCDSAREPEGEPEEEPEGSALFPFDDSGTRHCVPNGSTRPPPITHWSPSSRSVTLRKTLRVTLRLKRAALCTLLQFLGFWNRTVGPCSRPSVAL